MKRNWKLYVFNDTLITHITSKGPSPYFWYTKGKIAINKGDIVATTELGDYIYLIPLEYFSNSELSKRCFSWEDKSIKSSLPRIQTRDKKHYLKELDLG